MIALF